jgi:hypothetical protein
MANLMTRTEKEFASALASMTEDELFSTMRELENLSEEPGAEQINSPVFARIVLTESEIERRYAGQLLRPYREWKKRQVI